MDNDQSCPKKSVTTTPTTIHKKDPDFSLLQPFLGWQSTSVIRRILQRTNQYARLRTRTTLKRAFKSPNPALYDRRRNKSAAHDIFKVQDILRTLSIGSWQSEP